MYLLGGLVAAQWQTRHYMCDPTMASCLHSIQPYTRVILPLPQTLAIIIIQDIQKYQHYGNFCQHKTDLSTCSFRDVLYYRVLVLFLILFLIPWFPGLVAW